jgi:hypothetical protein
MTSEEQLRAALLGGGQFTTILASPRRSTSALSAPPELTDISSLSALSDSANDIWMLPLTRVSIQTTMRETQRLYRAIGKYYEESGALLRASEDAQWQSLRDDVFDRLEVLYAFRDRPKIKSFLGRNSFLTPLLFQVSDRIREFFDASAVVLEVSTDPDDGNYQELWARIQTDNSPADALPALTRFDEEWWLDASASSHDLLNIKLEYL